MRPACPERRRRAASKGAGGPAIATSGKERWSGRRWGRCREAATDSGGERGRLNVSGRLEQRGRLGRGRRGPGRAEPGKGAGLIPWRSVMSLAAGLLARSRQSGAQQFARGSRLPQISAGRLSGAQLQDEALGGSRRHPADRHQGAQEQRAAERDQNRHSEFRTDKALRHESAPRAFHRTEQPVQSIPWREMALQSPTAWRNAAASPKCELRPRHGRQEALEIRSPPSDSAGGPGSRRLASDTATHSASGSGADNTGDHPNSLGPHRSCLQSSRLVRLRQRPARPRQRRAQCWADNAHRGLDGTRGHSLAWHRRAKRRRRLRRP